MLKLAGMILIALLLAICGIMIVGRTLNYFKYRITSEYGIQESCYVEVNGAKHYLQIRGEDVNNPVIIFLHGGPASPMPYVAPYFQQYIEDKATFIQYDQRGCGRTFYENNCDSDTNLEMLVNDLDGIVDYARQRFGKEKVIIMGHSWGTALGTIYAQEHPGKVQAYIGVSQATNVKQNKLSAAKKALSTESIKGTEDETKQQTLAKQWSELQIYDDLSMEALGQMTQISKKYIGAPGEVDGLKMMSLGLFSCEMGIRDIKWFLILGNNDKYLSRNQDVLKYFIMDYDIRQLQNTYEMPVYYIGGEGDYILYQDDAKEYLNTIEAPKKQFFMMENVGHNMFIDNPKEFGKVVRRILKEL